MAHLADDLRFRGLVHQMTDPALEDRLDSDRITVYSGFDPTADSLHVGHLLQICNLRRMQLAGHRPIAVAGGGTGLVGDPGGKSEERTVLSDAQVEANLAGIRHQLEGFLDFGTDDAGTGALMVNNAEWLAPLPLFDFLRQVGKHFTVNQMVAKDSVKSRLSRADQGISYTEFSYMLLQANDFLQLFDLHGCAIQAGGSDQWGNITAGIDLVRKTRRAEVYGFTHPLLSTAGGEKFGKSAGNAVWLDAKQTSPYQFYQFWVQTEDSDVERYLKLFTFESLDAIAGIAAAHSAHPERREAQKLLAARMTEIVHGKEGLDEAVRASEALFGKELSGLSDEELTSIFAEVPSVGMDRTALAAGLRLTQVLMAAGACPCSIICFVSK